MLGWVAALVVFILLAAWAAGCLDALQRRGVNRWVRQLQQYEHGKADLLTSQQVEIGRRLARVRQQEKMDQMALLEKQRQRHAAQRTWRNKHLASGAMPQSSTYTTASDFV